MPSNDMETKASIIALTGGIGSGKSVVARLLRVMGYTVYDCDDRAKHVMTADPLLRQQLIQLFGPEAYIDAAEQGQPPQLNRTYLSSRIFGDASLLSAMNACVHPAVARDLMAQYNERQDSGKPFFFESAILFESGFDRLVPPDQVWTVSAPLEIRIARAMKRDAAPRAKVQARIESQMPQAVKEQRADAVIVNDDRHSVIQQVQQLLNPINNI